MVSENTVFIAGNIGRDPEIGVTKAGVKVANLSLAVTRCWRTDAGESREDTDFFAVECYGALATDAETMVTKGCAVFVRGWLKNVTWGGGERHKTVVMATTLTVVRTTTARGPL